MVFRALGYTAWLIFWPIRAIINLLKYFVYVYIGAPFVKYPVYPKAFLTDLEGKTPKDYADRIANDQEIYFKEFVGNSIKKFEIVLPSQVTLRGIQYLPESIKDSDDPFEDGFIWFEGTNSSQIHNHLKSIQALGDQLKRPVIGVDHRGIGWSQDSHVHSSIKEVISGLVYSLKMSIDQHRKDQSVEEYAGKVMIFGHSLGGGLGIAAAHKMCEEDLKVKVFSWASYSSLSAVPRALFGRLLLVLMIFVVLMWPLFHFPVFAPYWGSFGYTVTGILAAAFSAYVIGQYAPNFVVTILEWGLIRPIMILTGWQLDILNQAKELFDQGLLAFGHIMRAPDDLKTSDDPNVQSMLSRSGEDGFICPTASLTYAMESSTREMVRRCPEKAEFFKGAYAVNNTGAHYGGFYTHTLGPEAALTQGFQPMMERIDRFYSSSAGKN